MSQSNTEHGIPTGHGQTVWTNKETALELLRNPVAAAWTSKDLRGGEKKWREKENSMVGGFSPKVYFQKTARASQLCRHCCWDSVSRWLWDHVKKLLERGSEGGDICILVAGVKHMSYKVEDLPHVLSMDLSNNTQTQWEKLDFPEKYMTSFPLKLWVCNSSFLLPKAHDCYPNINLTARLSNISYILSSLNLYHIKKNTLYPNTSLQILFQNRGRYLKTLKPKVSNNQEN